MRKAYQSALEIAERLTQSEPERADYQRDLSVSHERMGDLYYDLGQGEKAREGYQSALEIAERLTQAEPERADYQRDLSVSYGRMSDLYRDLEQGERACEAKPAESLPQGSGLWSGVFKAIRRFFTPGVTPSQAPAAPSPIDENAEPVLLGVAAPCRAATGERFTAHFAAYVQAVRKAVKSKLEALGEEGDRMVLDLAPDCHARWRIGAPVSVHVNCEHGAVTPSVRNFEWNGRENIASFTVSVDRDAPPGKVVLDFQVFLGSTPIAYIPLPITVGEVVVAAETVRREVRAPRSAFASYSSRDARPVAERLSALSHWAPDLDIFQDCLDLSPGESFKPNLFKQILGRDVFLLFWSRNAASSPWVAWEYATARDRKGLDAILPMPLEDPAIAAPPPEFAGWHFRDRFMIAGYALRKITEDRGDLAV